MGFIKVVVVTPPIGPAIDCNIKRGTKTGIILSNKPGKKMCCLNKKQN